MNNFILYLCVFFIVPLSACPTSIGRVVHDSPPFFSKEFYKKEFGTSSKKNITKETSPSQKKNTKKGQS